MVSLAVDILLESLELVHDEGLFSGVHCINGGVEGHHADTEDCREAAEFVHLLV